MNEIKEEFYKKFLPEGETEAEPIADFIDANLVTAKHIADWFLSRFSTELEKVTKEMEKKGEYVQKFSFDSFGNSTPDIKELEFSHDDEIYNQALSDIRKAFNLQ